MKIEEAKLSDINSIFEFFRVNEELAEGTNIENFEETFKWLFCDGETDKINYFVAKDSDDNIIAGYGLMPFPISINGEKYKAGLPCWLLVDKKHRKSLLALQIAQKLFSESFKSGISISYAMAIRKGLPIFHKAYGFKEIGNLPIYARPVNIKNIIKIKISNILFQKILIFLSYISNIYFRDDKYSKCGYDISEITEFKEDIDSLIENSLKDFDYFGYRNSIYLNWRFNSLKSREYFKVVARNDEGISGYIILRNMIFENYNVLAVVDFLFYDEIVMRNLIKYSINKAYKLNVDFVTVLYNTEISMFNIFKKNKFYNTGEKFSFLMYMPKKSNHLISGNIRNKWFITWYDHDWV